MNKTLLPDCGDMIFFMGALYDVKTYLSNGSVVLTSPVNETMIIPSDRLKTFGHNVILKESG